MGASGPASGWALSVSGRRLGPAVHTGRRGGGGGATCGIALGSELSAIVGMSDHELALAAASPVVLAGAAVLAAVTLVAGAGAVFAVGRSALKENPAAPPPARTSAPTRAKIPLRDFPVWIEVSSAAEPIVAYEDALGGGSDRRGVSLASVSREAGFAAGASARVLALAGKGLGSMPELGGGHGGLPV